MVDTTEIVVAVPMENMKILGLTVVISLVDAIEVVGVTVVVSLEDAIEVIGMAVAALLVYAAEVVVVVSLRSVKIVGVTVMDTIGGVGVVSLVARWY